MFILLPPINRCGMAWLREAHERGNYPFPFSAGAGAAGTDCSRGQKAVWRFLEIFTVNIRNKNTRAAYGQAAGAFLGWCEGRDVTRIEDVQPVHVAGYIEELGKVRSAPTVKQHLACNPYAVWLAGHGPGGAVDHSFRAIGLTDYIGERW
jgi:hypothetical protein